VSVHNEPIFFSKLFLRYISALPGKTVIDIFSFQNVPRAEVRVEQACCRLFTNKTSGDRNLYQTIYLWNYDW